MNQIRIIAGKWRGRKITLADNQQLRPTTDRVRETLFNWLMSDIPNARCLDVFAGSGILGLEALSRGAEQVVFCEAHRQTAQKIKQTLDMLDVNDQANIYIMDALKILQSQPDQPFDGVFLDPPFRQQLLPEVCRLLEENGWLNHQSWIYLEAEREIQLDFIPLTWNLHREKIAGDVKYQLYYRQ